MPQSAAPAFQRSDGLSTGAEFSGWNKPDRRAGQRVHTQRASRALPEDAAAIHTTLHTLTVREVKVMHMPPKPLKVRAMKIRTESSANNTDVICRGSQQVKHCRVSHTQTHRHTLAHTDRDTRPESSHIQYFPHRSVCRLRMQ